MIRKRDLDALAAHFALTEAGLEAAGKVSSNT